MSLASHSFLCKEEELLTMINCAATTELDPAVAAIHYKTAARMVHRSSCLHWNLCPTSMIMVISHCNMTYIIYVRFPHTSAVVVVLPENIFQHSLLHDMLQIHVQVLFP